MRIAKEYHWEMGHRLPLHEGPCRNVHGHSYRLRLEVEGSLGLDGMVIDFYDIDNVIEPLIAKLDHAFLCDESDELMLDFFRGAALKVVTVPFPSTVENICKWISEQLASTLSAHKNIELLSVRVYETAKAFAETSVKF
jgi:6-pyruvoyltetrahydropterin/6-carboxytetrahydropterin synthase